MTVDVTPDDEDLPPRPWPRPVRITLALLRVAFGAFIALAALFCFAVSLIPMLLEPHGPGLGWFGGAILACASLWLLSLMLRLIFNRPNYGGLLPPWFLRLFAVYLVAFPIFIVLTGRDASWSLLQYGQAALAVLSGFGYWGIAAWRKASHLRA
jgi:hypothetical protein